MILRNFLKLNKTSISLANSNVYYKSFINTTITRLIAERKKIVKTHYDTLGIAPNSSKDEVKKAFIKLAKKYHPDRNPENSNLFTEIATAYECLGSEANRAEYDRKTSKGTHSEFFRAESRNRQKDYSSSFFYNKKAREDMAEEFENEVYIDFKNLFGKDGKRIARKGEDILQNIEQTFLNSVQGIHLDLDVTKDKRCTDCNGSRCLAGTAPSKCWTCGGKGMLTYQEGHRKVHEDCWKCKGGGMTIKYPCKTCNGDGLIEVSNTEKLRINSGVKNGEEVIIKKKGHDSTFGDAGNLKINVTILRDKRFERKELDIMTSQDLTPQMAALGSTVNVDTIHGKQEVFLKPGLKQGDYIILRNQGIRLDNTKENEKKDTEEMTGNHLLHFKMKVPIVIKPDASENPDKKHNFIDDSVLERKYKDLYGKQLAIDEKKGIDTIDTKNKCYHVFINTDDVSDQDANTNRKDHNKSNLF